MPRVLPSDVVKMADRMFSGMVGAPNTFQQIGPDEIPRLAALAALVDAVPTELLILNPSDYAGLVAAVGYLRALGEAFQRHTSISLHLSGYDKNPVALIRDAMAQCPDEAPAAGTAALPFISVDDLRESIRGDLSAASNNLSMGEWKPATVLAGSAVEALLLWGLQEQQGRDGQAIVNAIAELRRGKLLSQDHLGTNLEGRDWSLHGYGEVAGHLKLVTADTLTLVRLARNFRNLIHPARAARLNQKCDRSTALTALAAAAAVVRDLDAWASSPSP
jgi:hypothetical protein